MKKQKPISELIQFAVVNIDKPTGPTSFAITDFVRKTLNLKKASHMGTLDPIVTGVLPITLGRACRLSEYFMHRDKEYVGIMRLHKNVSDSELKKQMKKFMGKIQQLPPVKSKVKREVREREIKKFEILEKSGRDILFLADVQAGTYIRKLISDLGIGISGAHMLELRRTKAGIFDESTLVNLYDFESAVEEYKKGDEQKLREMLVPAEFALSKLMPSIQLKENNLKQLLTGKPLMKSDIKEKLPKQEVFAGFNKDKFIAVYRKSREEEIIARPEFVFN